VLAHNHPSGDPEPSDDDIALTTRLQRAGEIIGITILEHVIVGSSEFAQARWVSLKETGRLYGV
jgi:DNA repair protein RadC